MNARQKLNQSYINGSLLLAGIIGACAESWTAFIAMTVIFVGLSIHAGEIRTTSLRKRRPHLPRRRGKQLINPTIKDSITMKVLCINNDGAGFADYVEIGDGTTVREFFDDHIENPDTSAYLIRVNRQPVAQDQVLRDGDRISITPTKIEGVIEVAQ